MMRHKSLASGGWQKLSLAEQLGNIGSEVSRAARWQDTDKTLFDGAVERALELFDLTLEDPRWRGRLKELVRAREVFCDAIERERAYDSSLEALEHYFFYFALVARRQKDTRV